MLVNNQKIKLSIEELDLICNILCAKIDALPTNADLSKCNLIIEKVSDKELNLTFNNFN